MRIVLTAVLVLATACASMVSPPDRKVASVSSKVRFFESIVPEDKVPTSISCEDRVCRYLEVEVVANTMTVRICEVDESAIFYGVIPEQAILKDDLPSSCSDYISNFEVTPKVESALKAQLQVDEMPRRDPWALALSGGKTFFGALGTLVAGFLSVVSFLDPVVPIFLITIPGTAMGATFTYQSGADFVDEVKGKPRVVYKSGNAEDIVNSFERGGVSAFLIASKERTLLSRIAASPTDFERFDKAWKKFSKNLRALEKNTPKENLDPEAFILNPDEYIFLSP